MAEFVSLQKKVNQIFQDNGLEGLPPVRVGFAMDVSGSTRQLFSSGVMQETVNTVFPIAFKLDDNGEMDFAKFGDEFTLLASVTKDNHLTYLDDHSVGAENQGTSYEPIVSGYWDYYFGSNKIKDLVGKLGGLFGKKQARNDKSLPAVVIVLTDGACADDWNTKRALTDVLKTNKDQPTFFIWVGVGNKVDFGYLEGYQRQFPNCDHAYFPSLEVSEDVIYSKLFTTKFITWLKGLK